jgi:predicted DNA-binding protein with PD1-like motif
MSGTISQFKGRSMARLNGVLAFADGSTVGGSIGIGTLAYACEVVITELLGGTLTRDFDPDTGLPLWKGGSLLVDPGSAGIGPAAAPPESQS